MADNGFEQLRESAESRFPGRVARLEGGAFAIVQEDLDLPVTFAPIPGSPEFALVRAPVLAFGDLARPGAFAVAALAGNFFWTGANGATLSAGADGKLYMTERRALSEFDDADALARFLDGFAETANDWRERSALYA